MGLSRLNRLIGILVLIFAIIYGWKSLFEARRPPCYTIDVKYFGPGNPPSDDAEDFSIKPFKVPFDRSQVDDMIDRVRKTRFYEPQIIVDNKNVNGSTYGFNRQTIGMVQEYLLNTFDWKKTVQELNTFDHYKTNIAGLDIHFVRITKNTQTTEKKEPIIFLHGWPGSFLEYLDVARLLNTSTSVNYDLIIPSLPGYGYSDASVRPGMNPSQIARIMQNLMQRLGHSSYVVCGGDWGATIGTHMAQLYPGHVRGLLITMPFPSLTWKHYLQLAAAYYINPSILLDFDEQNFLRKSFNAFDYFKFLWQESGYFHLQATKPDTIGYALNDSPLGLAAYILEKWARWSNTQHDVDQSQNSGLDRFTLDQLLSNVMLYWTTGTITSSMRLYFELIATGLSGNEDKLFLGPLAATVPVAVVNYRNELLYTPRAITRSRYPNIKLWLFHDVGGHFAAMEKPQEYRRDIEKFLSQI
jgi:pimeloyl-ACP methyl ester carboxylesterase